MTRWIMVVALMPLLGCGETTATDSSEDEQGPARPAPRHPARHAQDDSRCAQTPPQVGRTAVSSSSKVGRRPATRTVSLTT